MKRTVDELLKSYPYIGEDIQGAQKEINRYIELQQEARNPLKGAALTGMPHGYGVSDQTYNAVEKLIDMYQDEINKQVAIINELLEQKKWMDKALSTLNDEERRILYLRYSNYMAINKIAYNMRLCRNTVYKILDDAKDKIKRIAV